MDRRPLSQLLLAFFGLTSETAPQIRFNLFTQIHEIVFHGNGGYSWETIYNMPIWLRKFTFNKIQDHYTKQKEEIEKSKTGSNTTNVMDSSGNVNSPQFLKAMPKKPKSNFK